MTVPLSEVALKIGWRLGPEGAPAAVRRAYSSATRLPQEDIKISLCR